MTATQYHSSDTPFIGAFFVGIETEEGLFPESKYFSHFIMADDFIFQLEEEWADTKDLEIFVIDNEDVLQYLLEPK